MSEYIMQCTTNMDGVDCYVRTGVLIRCKDCKYMQEDKIFHQCWCNGREVKYDHFCGYAERRTDA